MRITTGSRAGPGGDTVARAALARLVTSVIIAVVITLAMVITILVSGTRPMPAGTLAAGALETAVAITVALWAGTMLIWAVRMAWRRWRAS